MNQHYQALGLKYGASKDDIKKAYRTLSKKYHPDLNKEDGAEDRFKKISDAYQSLTNDKPKQNNFNNKFNSNFRRNIKAKNILYNIEINLEEAFYGTKKNVTISKKIICKKCNGEGGLDKIMCNQCHGNGGIRNQNIVYMCNNCFGKGVLFVKKCGDCMSEGYKKENINLKFDIIPGIKNDTNLIKRNVGSEVVNGISGDVILNVKIKQHDKFMLDGNDLKFYKNISILDIFLGTEINFDTLDGEVKIKIPKFSDASKPFRLKNKGMLCDGKRGDFLLYINPLYPKNLNVQEEALLNALKNSPNFKVLN